MPLQAKIYETPWIDLWQDGPYRGDELTPMEWCPVARQLTYERRMRVIAKDPAAFLKWVKTHPDAHLYRVLSHEPVQDGAVDKGDELYDKQLVRDRDEIYIDDYGLRCFCTTRLSPVFKEDMDLRNDNDDYTGEYIGTI